MGQNNKREQDQSLGLNHGLLQQFPIHLGQGGVGAIIVMSPLRWGDFPRPTKRPISRFHTRKGFYGRDKGRAVSAEPYILLQALGQRNAERHEFIFITRGSN